MKSFTFWNFSLSPGEETLSGKIKTANLAEKTFSNFTFWNFSGNLEKISLSKIFFKKFLK